MVREPATNHTTTPLSFSTKRPRHIRRGNKISSPKTSKSIPTLTQGAQSSLLRSQDGGGDGDGDGASEREPRQAIPITRLPTNENPRRSSMHQGTKSPSQLTMKGKRVAVEECENGSKKVEMKTREGVSGRRGEPRDVQGRPRRSTLEREKLEFLFIVVIASPPLQT